MKLRLSPQLSASARRALPVALAASLLAGCSMPRMDIWPFNGSSDTGNVPPPANASLYQCNSGASFWLRKLADGNMWLIYPDRQIRLDKQSDGRFSNGIAVLQFEGETATLRDGPQINYGNCAVAQAKK
jgi:hypothetical protein